MDCEIFLENNSPERLRIYWENFGGGAIHRSYRSYFLGGVIEQAPLDFHGILP